MVESAALFQLNPLDKLLTRLEALPTKDTDVQERPVYFTDMLELQRLKAIFWQRARCGADDAPFCGGGKGGIKRV